MHHAVAGGKRRQKGRVALAGASRSRGVRVHKKPPKRTHLFVRVANRDGFVHVVTQGAEFLQHWLPLTCLIQHCRNVCATRQLWIRRTEGGELLCMLHDAFHEQLVAHGALNGGDEHGAKLGED